MRLFNSLLIGVLTFTGFQKLATAQDTDDPFCACTDCCYVDNTTDFSYKNLVSLTFKDVSFSGEYTILDDGGTHEFNGTTYDGTPYQYVVKYRNDPLTEFDNNVRIFSADTGATLNCSESFVYYFKADGTPIKLDLILESEDGFSYCSIDIDEKLTRDEINDYNAYGGVYFAFNHLVEERTEFRIMFDIDNRVVPIDDVMDYQYFLNTTTLDAGNEESDFWIKFILEISDINDMAVDGSCLSFSDVMQDLYLGPDDADADRIGNCTLGFFPGFVEPSAPGFGETVTYEFILPQSKYERCAEQISSNGDEIVFHSTLNFPTKNDEETCFYFQPGFSRQPVTITIDADVSEQVTETFEQYSIELLEMDIERCTPIEDYIIPQAQLRFIIRTTFAGDSNDLSWVQASVPYINGETGESFDLFGGHSLDSDASTFNCTTYDEGLSTEYTECWHYFKTKKCENIYTARNDDGDEVCAFERNNTRFIHNLEFRQELEGGLFVSHRSARLDTNLEFTFFPESSCTAPGDRAPINVNDVFPSNLVVRNFYYGVATNWTNTSDVSFNDNIILRLGVGEEAGTQLNDLAVFIKTVVVTLADANDIVLSQFTYNVAEKEQFMQVGWSLFFNDPHFCSWHDDALANTCQSFYDSNTDRWNSGMDQTRVNQVCQLQNTFPGEADTRNTDFFAFNPPTWFVDLVNRPYLKVTFTVNGVLYECEDLQRRRLEASDDVPRDIRRKLQANQNSIMYVSDELVIIFGENAEGEEEVVIIEESPSSSSETRTIGIVLGAVGGVLLLVALVFALAKGCKKRDSQSVVGFMRVGANVDDF